MTTPSYRIALCNWSNRMIGGTETYLGNLARFLRSEGHVLSFFTEGDIPQNRAFIELPDGTPVFNVARDGRGPAFSALRAWAPDVVYVNIMEDTTVEAELLDVAPGIFDAHAFYGTCVGQTKCFKFPEVRPCTRTFGWQCLALYYPRRCGGLNPLTMVQRYRKELDRNRLLGRYRAVVTHSEFMRDEYIRHGVSPDATWNVSAGLTDPTGIDPAQLTREAEALLATRAASSVKSSGPARLLFVGRMDRLKGGSVLIDALPSIQRELNRPVQLTLAGDGPAREEWNAQAVRLTAANADIDVRFAGWVPSDQMGSLYTSADLLVVPSLWPEPFGRIGLEAGRYGVPSAAFAVGGIPDWLFDGTNGHLASGDPPTSRGLADAVVQCLRDPAHLIALQRGAERLARSGGRGGSWPVIGDVLQRAIGHGH